jgi:hypothetical protein
MVKYMRWLARILGLVYGVFAIYFWFFQYEPRLLPAAILLSVPFVVAVAIAWKWQGKSPELLGGILFILLGLVPLVHFAASSGVIIFCSEPITVALCFPPLVFGILFILAYSMSKSSG